MKRLMILAILALTLAGCAQDNGDSTPVTATVTPQGEPFLPVYMEYLKGARVDGDDPHCEEAHSWLQLMLCDKLPT